MSSVHQPPTRRYLLATRSRGKIREVRALVAKSGLPIEVTTPEDLRIEPDPRENEIEEFSSFRENAIAKALYFARLSGKPTIADDSGLAVDALKGEPGVRSKRFSGRTDLEGEELDQANIEYLLQRLEGVPDQKRNAYFACAVALARPEGDVITTLGTVSGRITREERGSQGFGYDPLFLIPELGKTFAELGDDEKNRLSHRARALNALLAQIGFFR